MNPILFSILLISVSADVEPICAPYDEHDHECFNTTVCEPVTMTTFDGSDCSAISGDACSENVDDLGRSIGTCLSVAESNDVMDLYCNAHILKSSCLNDTDGNCQWQQECTSVSDYCNSEDVCNVFSGCHFDGEECAVPDDGSYFRNKWGAAIVLLLVGVIGIGLPMFAEKFFAKPFRIIEPFLYSASAAALIGISFIHLLSEAGMYAGNADLHISDKIDLSPHWITYSCTLIAALFLDAFANHANQHLHSEMDIKLPVKITQISNPDAVEIRQVASLPISEISDVNGNSEVSTLLKYTGIIIHGAQEGVVVGIQENELTWILTVVMVFHKILFAISLGQELKNDRSKFQISMAVCFIMSTPVALISGAYLISDVDDGVFAHLNAFSAALVLNFGLETLFDLPCIIGCASTQHNEKETENMINVDSAIPESSSDSENAHDSVLVAEPKSTDREPETVSADSPSVKWKIGQYVIHYLIIQIVVLIVFGLMMWHLSVHNHEESHEHEH